MWMRRFFLKNLRPQGDRSACFKLEKSRAVEAGDLSQKSGEATELFTSLPALPPSLSLSFETKCIHTPKLRADTAECLSEPLPLATSWQKRSWAAFSGAPFVTPLNRLGLAFKRQLGLGTMFHFLTPLIGLWVRAIMKTSFGVSCNCPGKCTCTGPKATEGGRAGQICFVYGAHMATDKWSVPWDSSVDRPTAFPAAPRGP